jgi:regulation of enolase protein 1 (concanavalin A-like superfamily)
MSSILARVPALFVRTRRRSNIAFIVAFALLAATTPGSAESHSALTLESVVIGAPEQPGTYTSLGERHRVSAGAGTIGGRSDSYRLAYLRTSGDMAVTTRILDQTDSQRWAGASLVIREGTGAGDANASLTLSPRHGALFQYRATRGGDTAQVASGQVPTPAWLRLERAGDSVTAAFSTDGRTWSSLGTAKVSLGSDVNVGVGAFAHQRRSLNTVTFGDLAVSPAAPTQVSEPESEPELAPELQPEPTGNGRTSTVVGSPLPTGSTSVSEGVWSVSVGGRDIWDNEDEFRFVHESLSGDGTITARVTGLHDTHIWAKAGVMIRDGLRADARHLSLFVTPARGIALQGRQLTGGESTHFAGTPGAAPSWVRLVRRGDHLTASISPDGTTWTKVGSATVTLPATVQAGLAVTSHNDGTATTATFTNVSLTNTTPEPESEPEAAVSPGGGVGERLGLHVTGEELQHWRARWSGGGGDSFLNARISEERTRVTNNKNAFMSNPSGHLYRYTIQSTDSSGCITGNVQSIPDHGDGGLQTARHRAAVVRDAAFWALVSDAPLAERQNVLNAVRNVMLQQPDQQNVNNWYVQHSTPWCPLSKDQIDAPTPFFVITHAVLTSLFAYDYLDVAISEGLIPDFTAAQREKMRKWFVAWAYKVEPNGRYHMDRAFNDWWNRDLRLKGYTGNWIYPDIYQGGPTATTIGNLWNNRRVREASYIAVAGVKFDESYLQGYATRWFEDLIRYHVYPQGTMVDMHRGWGSQLGGLGYMSLLHAHAMTGVDVLARADVANLYEFSTTQGHNGTAGAPHAPATDPGKNYKFAAETIARYGNHTWDRRNGNNQRYSFHDGNLGYHDRLIVGNLYWKSNLVRDFYRGQNGMHPWRVTANGGSDLNDSWSLPAPYLMWADLEGKVWPYPQ